jgi:predicted amidophosphoribosyltransferase
MSTCSNALGKSLNPDWLKEATFVPIPPSKAKGDPEYDDRMRVICEKIPAESQIDVRDLVWQTESYEAAHESDHRPSVADLLKIYQINEDASAPAPKAICIMDDVLTAGVHYRAMHTVLSRRFPGISIVGIFIARRVFPPNDPAGDFEAVENGG